MLEVVYRDAVESQPEFHRMNLVNAELCKISVNTFVTTKISYANMIAEMCEHLPGADAEVVTRAVGADSRIGRKYLKPAIGYGGPCFPRDNKAFAALGRRLGVNTALAEATDRINDHQLQRLIGAVSACADPGRAVAVLGLSYKPDTAVVEESQGVALALALAEEGYRVRAFDPLANAAAAALLGDRAEVVQSAEAALAGAAVAVVTTAWPQFRALDFAAAGLSAVVDPWGMVAETAAGLRLIRLGRGDWRREVAVRNNSTDHQTFRMRIRSS
jgi:UDPglucose 6-dehydrogenase